MLTFERPKYRMSECRPLAALHRRTTRDGVCRRVSCNRHKASYGDNASVPAGVLRLLRAFARVLHVLKCTLSVVRMIANRAESNERRIQRLLKGRFKKKWQRLSAYWEDARPIPSCQSSVSSHA